MSDYETFMAYELDDSGERRKLDITQEDLQSNLHPEQVLVLVREELRRIFIWKGPKSPVRKRFISSRVAQALQEELMNDAKYHRCKIVSVDAGDEPTEFLNAFNLESMEVTERLADMRYVRNIEKERMAEAVITDAKTPSTSQKEEEYFSPALQDMNDEVVVSSFATSRPTPTRKESMPRQPYSVSYPSEDISESQKKEIMEKILNTDTPVDYKRLNLILGNTLYAAVSKTANVFGDDVVETEWEPVKKVPKKIIELNNHVLRVYFGDNKSLVEAIEVLEKKGASKPPIKAAPKKKPQPKKKPAPKKKPGPKKKPTMTPIPEKPESMKTGEKPTSKSSGRRELPKIPSTED
ncbi:MAG: hypothetical protein ACFFDB_06690 [Promethearchaeota archaeon]